MSSTNRILILALVLLPLVGCGYALSGRGSSLPSDLKVLAVPPFEAPPQGPHIADGMRDAVIDQFLSRTSLRITEDPEQADLVLLGEITDLRITPLAYGEEDRTTRGQASVRAGVVLKRTKDGEVLYENRAFSFRSEYELTEESEDFYSLDTEVIDDISQQFAESLVAAMLAGF